MCKTTPAQVQLRSGMCALLRLVVRKKKQTLWLFRITSPSVNHFIRLIPSFANKPHISANHCWMPRQDKKDVDCISGLSQGGLQRSQEFSVTFKLLFTDKIGINVNNAAVAGGVSPTPRGEMFGIIFKSLKFDWHPSKGRNAEGNTEE